MSLFLILRGDRITLPLYGSEKTKETGDGSMLRFYAVNVGQGDCSCFILPTGETILVDAGTPESVPQIKAFLKEHNIRRIDLLVATHPHSDHIGSICYVINNYEVGEVWDSGYNYGSVYQRKFYQAVKKKQLKFGRPKAGYVRKIGEAEIRVLAPVKELRGTRDDANNNSIVFLLSYGKVKFLMTGDMEREEWDSFQIPQADVLKVSHHGSFNGTNAFFLRRARPSIVTLSYGAGNSYGYPHKKVVKLINQFDLLRFDTVNGTICLAADGREIKYDKNQLVK